MTKKTLKVVSTLTLIFILTGCAKVQEAPIEIPEEPVETAVETPVAEEPMTEMYLEDYIVTELDLSVTTVNLSQLSDEELKKGMVLGDVAIELFALQARDKETPGESPRLLIEKIGNHMTKRFLKQMEGELASEIEDAKNEDIVEDKYGNIIEEREDGSVLRIEDDIKLGDLIDYEVTDSHIAYSREIKYTIREYADEDADKGKILREEIKPVFLWFKVEDGEIKLNGYGF